jgi:hypothetical protein
MRFDQDSKALGIVITNFRRDCGLFHVALLSSEAILMSGAWC